MVKNLESLALSVMDLAFQAKERKCLIKIELVEHYP